MLVDQCLHQMLIENILTEEKPEVLQLMELLEQMVHSFLKEDGNITLETLSSSTVLANLSSEINEKKRNLIAQSRTAELWTKYLQMIGTARALIIADRTGSWPNHLKAVEE